MVIFITGATAGFGAMMVKHFALNGDLVVASGRRIEKLQSLQRDFGDKVHPLVLDVQDKNAVIQSIKTLPEKFSKIDVLINNAGLALGMEPAQKSLLSDWETMVDTNIKGLLNCTHAILPGMIARNRGHIVNLGSVAGEFPYPNGNVYGATKAFVHQFSLNLRADLLGTALRVTCIEPGMCGGTEFSDVRFKGDKAKAESIYKGVVPITSEDIAETVHWVVSRPAHVNINVISMMPVQQAFAPFAIHRE
ncbi:MAG: SDR family NAD(P)-dependent oxidoreductase [Pseudomonadota bacterium]|nr:SDR family NAD(P)-dependent oxidoreductase [Pseudomonadota bacterium]